MRCQCLERGCIEIVLSLSFCWKMVMTSCCSGQSSSSKRPLSLPMPCLPSTPFQEFASWPTVIEITKDYHQGVLWRQLLSSSKTCLFLQVQLEELEYSHWKAWHTTYFIRRRTNIMQSEWSIGRISSLKAMEVLTMKPMPKMHPSVVGFSD